MPVAGSIKLDLIADSQDRATATLRAVQGELKKTEDRIRSASAAGKEDGDISDILARGSEKSRSALRSEVDAREAAAATRRKAVQAAREAAGATAEEGSALDKLKGNIEGANKKKELFNKTLGLAGFVGVAVGAIASFAELIDEATGYQSAIKDATKQQEDFNKALAGFAKGNRDFDIESLSKPWQEVARAQDEVQAKTEEYLKNQQLRDTAIGGEAQANARILAIKERIRKVEADNGPTMETITLALELDELEQKRATWQNQIKDSLAQEPGLHDQIKAAQERANIPLQAAKMLSADLSSNLEGATKFAEGVGDALNESFGKVSWNPFNVFGQSSEDAGKDIEKKEKERLAKEEAARKRGASAGESAAKKAEREAKELADKETGIRREIALLEIQARYEDEYSRKMAALGIESDRLEEDLTLKKIARSTYELQRRKLDLELNLQIAEENKRVGEEAVKAEEKKAEGIAKAAKAAKDAKDKADKDAADALEKRAKGIEKIGDYARQADAPLKALSGRLGGLAQSVDETAGVWANYERGQASLGDAVSGTLGSIGSAVAASISDKKAQAAVEGGFESAASIASFASGNIPAGIGHAAAAAAFFGVAAGGGASASSGAGGGGAGRSTGSNVIQGNFGQRTVSSQQADTRVSVVHHYGEGIVYGLGADVAKTASGTADSLRWTGMHRRRF